ncbi:hypothetical protein PybrP1_004139 [[Pythium] brassicae (nom. inval.)]|nr:hypothetical protein PybrP1_004139 [[Pythium] brassicae (nom. inval.)]
MDEEALELVQLQRMLVTRKQALVAACTERLSSYREEQKLIRSIADVRARAERAAAALQRKELALMVEEEVAQTLNDADQLSNAIERAETQARGDEGGAGTTEKQLEELNQRFQVALRRSIVQILELGRMRTENQLQGLTKRFAEQQERDDERDLDELRKLARDVDCQSEDRVSVLLEMVVSELMSCTAEDFCDKVQDGVQVFMGFYAPRTALSASHGWHPTEGFAIPTEVRKLKEDAFSRHLTALLASVKAEKDQSLDRRMQATDALRTAIERRERCKQRVLALETRLTEAKRRNCILLQQLKRCRSSYEKAIAMAALLQNFKMDPVFKSWFAVGEFHTASIADWYALRADCADDIERLEREIQGTLRQLDLLNNAVEQQRVQWMAASISDVQACERSEQHQELVHRAVEQVVGTEEARVYHLLSCFDLRRKWISYDSEKYYDALKRKLRVYERIRTHGVETQQEQAATGRRIDSVIRHFQSEVDAADGYLALLKCTDQALYQQGLSWDDAFAGASEEYGYHIRTHLPFVLRVFEYYARQRWTKHNALALLSAVSTDADARDAAGNIAEVIFDASLDSSEVEQIFATGPKHRVEEQWRVVALVVLFFARLFRRSALQLLQQDHQTQEITPTLARISAGLLKARPLHHALGVFYDQRGEIQELALRFERVRAEFERQPPKPSGLELVCAGNNMIEIKWTPLSNDTDLVYAAEIQHWSAAFKTESSSGEMNSDDRELDRLGKPGHWDLSMSDSKSTHRFHRLIAESYKPNASECLELFRALKNKDELSHSCREIMEMLTANDKGVMENHSLNTRGGQRTRGGISHAALQRRFTGKMSGHQVSS